MWYSRALGAMLLVAAAASRAPAQDSSGCGRCTRAPHAPNEFERRSSGSFAVIQSRPQGQLSDNIGLGYGVDGAYLFALDRRGVVSLRLSAGFLQYGGESKRVPLSSTIGGRIQVKVSTDNYIVPVIVGPQLTAPNGWVRPYVNAGVGGQFFYTQSHVDGTDDSFDFARTTNQSDATATWAAGGGLLIPLHERNVKVLLDIGATFFNGGRAQYLRPGSIEDVGNSQIRVTPFESETHFTLVRVGVKVGL
jgi:opacity protein-like surface antigen